MFQATDLLRQKFMTSGALQNVMFAQKWSL